ncbi:MAG: oligosaccharide flippase family protein [Pseudomonadota bacterium]
MRVDLAGRLARLDRIGLIRVGGAMALSRALSIVTGVLLSVLLARHLGAAGYGGYLFALTVAQMLAMPVLLGLPTLLMRQIAVYRSDNDAERLAGVVRWSLKFVLTTFAAVVIGFSIFLVASRAMSAGLDQVTPLYLLTLPLVAALACLQLASAFLQGFDRPLIASLPDSLIRPALLLALISILIGLDILTPALTMALHVVAALAAFSWAVVMVVRHCDISAIKSGPSRIEPRRWLGSLLPLSVLVGAGLINSRLDVFMLGTLTSNENVALYGIATQIAGIAGVAYLIPSTIIAPRIVTAHQKGDAAEVQKICQAASIVSLAASATFFVVLALLGEMIVGILLGASYGGAIVIALVLCVGQLIIASMGPAMVALNMMGREYSVTNAVLVSAGLNGCLNAFLIPWYGGLGAALATVVSSAVSQIYCATRLNTYFGVKIGPISLVTSRGPTRHRQRSSGR